MKFSINSKTLEGNLDLLSKAVSVGKEVGVKALIMLEQNRGTLYQTAVHDDGSMVQIASKIDDVNGAFKVCLSAQHLLNAIKGLQTQRICFEVGKKEVKLSYEGGSLSLPVQEADEFPDMPDMNIEGTQNIFTGEALSTAIKRCISATANDQIRLQMTGIYVEVNEDNYQVVGTDGRRVVCTKNQMTSGNKVCFILPKRIAKMLTGINSKKVSITFDGRDRLEIVCDGYLRISANAIEGQYPNYKAIMSNRSKVKAVVGRTALSTLVGRVAYFANAGNAIQLFFRDNELVAGVKNPTDGYSMGEKMKIAYTDDKTAIRVSSVFLQDMLRSLSEKDITMFLPTEVNKPLMFKQSGEGYLVLSLLMQMQPSEELDDEYVPVGWNDDAEETEEEPEAEETEEEPEAEEAEETDEPDEDAEGDAEETEEEDTEE